MANVSPHRFVQPPLMNVLWFEFMLSLHRLGRRRVQNGLMLLTFAVSIALALLSWSLFHTMFLSRPAFDPTGELCIATFAGSSPTSGVHATESEFRAMQAGQTVFSDFAEIAFYSSEFITTNNGTERVLAAYVSSSALRLVGARPLLGRLFTAAEDKHGAPRVIIISHRLWQTRFDADPAIIGKAISTGGQTVTVVGVMPADFRFPNDQEVWFPTGQAYRYDWYAFRDGLARLKPGVTPERAARDLQVILDGLGPETPANKRGYRAAVIPFRDYYLEPQLRVSALILFSLSLLFVIVSCVNAANLMLIDFLGRRPETAATLALGIPRTAALRGLCFQIVLIAAASALLGLGVLLVLAPVIHHSLTLMNAPYWLEFSFGPHHVWMAVALAVASAAMTLILPAAYLLWMDPERMIREHAHANRGSGHALWRRLLLVAQIALLTVLGVCAGLLVRSSAQVSEEGWGYEARRVFIASISTLSAGQAKNGDWVIQDRVAVYNKILDEVMRLPGMEGAAFMSPPMGYSGPPNCTYALDPDAITQNHPLGEAKSAFTTDGLFAALGVPFVAGTTFPKTRPSKGISYAVITASLAQRLWPGQSALQRTLYLRIKSNRPDEPLQHLVICGVLRNFQASGPMAQNNDGIYVMMDEDNAPGTAYFMASGKTLPTAEAIREAVHRIDPRMALYFSSTLGQQIDLTLGSVHLTTRLTLLYAIAAVLLCAIGVYSLTVSQVLQSSREFGIRMALGGEPILLWRNFTRGHLFTALLGVLIGWLAATQVARILKALLYGVDAHNPAIYAGVAGAILLVAILACIPSLFRLKRINPADCLRSL